MKKIPTQHFLFIAALFFTAFLFMPKTAYATLDEATYSDAEKVAFAFAKLGHFKPDYAGIIRVSPAYDTASPVDKVELMRQNGPRLQAGFAAYDPDQDLIHVMADVKIMHVDTQNAAQKSPGAKLLKIIFPVKNVVFPFQIGDLWVDLMPDGFDATTPISLTDADYANFMQAMGGERSVIPAVLEMRLRPLAVDKDHPGSEMNQPAWPLIAAVRQITIWDKARQHVAWRYDAAGYQSADTKRLNDLYLK